MTVPLETSYGTVEGVASLSAMWTDQGQFTGSTRPTDEQVSNWINQVSNLFDIALANEGFVVPVVNNDKARGALGQIVEQYVSELVQSANSSGRFFTERYLKSGVGPITQIGKDLGDWANLNSAGLEGMGVVRRSNPSERILFRDSDDDGDAVEPIFQRKAFGNRFPKW